MIVTYSRTQTYATTQNFLSLTKGDRLGESPASVMVLWVETLWHFWWVVDYKIQYSYQLKLSQKSTVNPIFICPGTYLFQGHLRVGGGGGGLIKITENRSLQKKQEHKVEKLLVGGHTAEEKQLTSLNVQSSYICTYHICLLNKNSGGAWKREGGRLSRFLSLKKLEGLERGGGGGFIKHFRL